MRGDDESNRGRERKEKLWYRMGLIKKGGREEGGMRCGGGGGVVKEAGKNVGREVKYRMV